MKIFHPPPFPSQWKVLVLRAVLARFLCLSGFRLSSTVAGAQETLAAARTCPLLVSLLAILSPHEYPEGADGEGVGETLGTEQKTAGIKQSTLAHQEQAGEQLFLPTASWQCPPHASDTLLLQLCLVSHSMLFFRLSCGEHYPWASPPRHSCSTSSLSVQLCASVSVTFSFPLQSFSV